MMWRDATRQLTLEPGPPAGATNVTAPARTFRVQVLPEGTTQDVKYAGTRVQVTIK
jgi:hypothetical protein